MKNIIIMAVIALAISATSMVAQSSIGLRAGVNFQNLNGKSGGENLDYKLTLGFNMGINAEIGIAPDMYFQPGLLFSTKGAKQEAIDFGEIQIPETTVKLNYLEIPLNLVYKPILGSGKLIAGFGPYVAYAIGGKTKTNDESEDIKFGSGDGELNPLDMGANLLFGYEFSNMFSVQMNVQLGLINMINEGDSDNSMKNTGFGFSLGYRF